MRLQDKIIVVTGAGSGIGRLATRVFAEQGAIIAAIDLPPFAESAIAPEGATVSAPSHHSAWLADITDKVALDAVGARIVERHGHIDGVFACAAILRGGGLLSTDPADHDRTMRVNIDGTINTICAMASGLRAAGGGSIVLMSSLAGTRANPSYASYVVSKHAVIGVMRVAAKELGSDSIRVNTINPTIVDTPMTRDDRVGRDDGSFEARAEALKHRHALPVAYVEPVDVVNAAVFLLSDEARYVTSATFPVDAGASA